MENNSINKIEEDFWMGMSFKDELLEFTRANRVEKERAIQNARSRGGDQKDVDKARKSVDRKQEKQQETTNPWKNVIIVRTNQDGKVRLIPKADFTQDRHELLFGQVSGQAPKPEVTPNIAQEMSSQDDFEASKTSNRLLGVISKKKKSKDEIIRSDHYDYPKDGVQRQDPASTYPDWDHSPDSIAQGISLVANSTGGKPVDIDAIKQFFGQSQTLMDSSIRAYQQLNDIVKGQFSVTTPDEVYATTKAWTKITGGQDRSNTDLIIQDESGVAYCVSIIQDKTKIIVDDEAQVLFDFCLKSKLEELASDEKIKKSLEKIKKKVSDYIISFGDNKSIQQKYLYSRGEDFKIEIIADLEEILQTSDVLESSIVIEALTGNEKFGGKLPAVSNALMSTSRDGTNLRMVPLNTNSTKQLLGETYLKLKLRPSPDGSPFDEMYEMLVSSRQNTPQLSEFLNLSETVNDGKVFFDNFMSEQKSLLEGFIKLLGLVATSVIVSNINLDAVGSVDNGDYTRVDVGKNRFYVGVEKNVDYYDGSALRLGESMEDLVLGLSLIMEKERDYKKEYNGYHKNPIQIARRSSRNKARAKAKKEGRVSVGDGKDVDHKNHNAMDNSNSNLRVRDRSSNRGDNKVPVKEEYGAGETGTWELLLKYIQDTPYMTIPRDLLKKEKHNVGSCRKCTEK